MIASPQTDTKFKQMKNILKSLFILVLAILLNACHKEEDLILSMPVVQAGSLISSENLVGNVKGTMQAGKTYYFDKDITVNDGDTLLMQSGVTLIAVGDGTKDKAPQLTVHGTFISLGTKEKPNYITIQNAATYHTEASAAKYDNVFKGSWGGILASPAPVSAAKPNPKGGDVIIKWTHIEFAGAASYGNDASIYKDGDARYAIYFANIEKDFILEDSWIFGSADDGIRTVGGKIAIMRNTFELCGKAGGECFNMKSGTVGDLAYNMLIGSATNALKASNSGATTIQCNVNMYNNTMTNCGFRQTKTGRGGSINYEQGARGLIYNNLISNCRFGLRITTDADQVNIKYNNQYYYGSTSGILAQFLASDGVAKNQSADVKSATAKDKNPLFFNYNADQYDYTANPGPITASLMPAYITTVGTANFSLQANSPGHNKAKTDFTPMAVVKTTGNFGAIITPPGNDIGAFQTDGSGNQH
ncbi:hypothetical protein GCM10022289_17690 [Pedobacter jeongneungensis]|uniref:Right handed beta helix region n=2 Tax=Pedobacter jeongneungensis TaxID=947309 RepID=A0ABP8BBN8_9SPHI